MQKYGCLNESKEEIKKKSVSSFSSSSSWCPRHARRACSPGCLRLWGGKAHRRRCCCLVHRRTTKRAHCASLPPLDALKQQRRGAAVRLCCPKPEPGDPSTDTCLDQSRAAWVDRLPEKSQSERGVGAGMRGGPLVCFIKVFSHWNLHFFLLFTKKCKMCDCVKIRGFIQLNQYQ